MMQNFKPIKNIKVYEQVIEQIKEMIYNGSLKRGDKLPSERELRSQFHVSRASIREAFRVMEMIGLIESRPGEGTFIREHRNGMALEPLSLILMLEDDLALELLELRRVLEIDCVRLAAERVTEEELAEMKKHIGIMEESAGHEEHCVKADAKFHFTIAKASKNRVLYDVMMAISQAMDFHIKNTRTKLVSDRETMMNFIRQHYSIFEGLREGNSEKAMKAMRDHLDYVEGLIKKNIEKTE
ncbi:MAG: FadR/GntR family transcriptional regulator [Peptococcaceae bacterium]|jgi:GntR family transcriptional repressor for pyruvate dehydrogenase complex|nr:FadR family transcriptional regulator [Peptococcaceae bacterium]MDH7525922.1 FadR/GntR family transcriptional regulator [Peptococcaceae bacterium]